MQTPGSEKEENVVHHGRADIPLQPVEDLSWYRWIFPKHCSPWWTTLEQRRSLGRKEQQGQVLTITHTHHPCAAWDGKGSEGVKLSLEEG